MAWTREGLAGADLRWLLVINIAGRVFRFSTKTVDVPDAATGKTWMFIAGLSPLAYERAIAPPGDVATEAAVQVEILFTKETAGGFAALAAGLLDTGDSTAELSLWRTSDDYASRVVMLSGYVDASEYGAAYEPMTLTLTEAPWRASSARIPADTMLVNGSTWAPASGYKIGDGMGGQFYPSVIGAPGYRQPDVGGTYPGVPALLVTIDSATLDNSANDAVFVIGSGRLLCVGVSNSVKLLNKSTGAAAVSFTPTASTDDRGQAVTIVTVSAAALPINDGDSVYTHFVIPATGGQIDNEGQPMRSADEVIRWLLENAGARTDLASLKADLFAVRSYLMDFYINEDGTDPIDVLLDSVLPLLPLATFSGPDGLSFRRWPFDAVAADAIAHLDLSVTIGERLGRVTRSSANDVSNSIAIEYAPNAVSNEMQGRFGFASSSRIDQTDIEEHPYAIASASRYGSRDGTPITANFVVDPATAEMVLNWQIMWKSQTRETVRYGLPQSWQALTPGDVVTVTDSDIGWSDRPCVVLSVLNREGPTELVFQTLPSWLRSV